MNWKITEHKRGDTQNDLKVSSLVKEMKECWCYNAISWCDFFNTRLAEIRCKNAFKAEHLYKATPRNQESLEVWKLKANGDFNYKMFTVDIIKNG